MMAAYENDIDDLLKHEPKITSIRIAQLLRDKYPSIVLGERAARNTFRAGARCCSRKRCSSGKCTLRVIKCSTISKT